MDAQDCAFSLAPDLQSNAFNQSKQQKCIAGFIYKNKRENNWLNELMSPSTVSESTEYVLLNWEN
jgi:hypothetical protein